MVKEVDVVKVNDGQMEIFECINCGGFIGIDGAFLDQVNQDIDNKCPYCGERYTIKNKDEE